MSRTLRFTDASSGPLAWLCQVSCGVSTRSPGPKVMFSPSTPVKLVSPVNPNRMAFGECRCGGIVSSIAFDAVAGDHRRHRRLRRAERRVDQQQRPPLRHLHGDERSRLQQHRVDVLVAPVEGDRSRSVGLELGRRLVLVVGIFAPEAPNGQLLEPFVQSAELVAPLRIRDRVRAHVRERLGHAISSVGAGPWSVVGRGSRRRAHAGPLGACGAAGSGDSKTAPACSSRIGLMIFSTTCWWASWSR